MNAIASSIILLYNALLVSKSVAGFSTTQGCRPLVALMATAAEESSSSSSSSASESTCFWINLVPDNDASPVRKTVLEAAAKENPVRPTEGSVVTIEYTGSLWMDADGIGNSIPSWDTQATVDCWLSNQQGLSEALLGPFETHSVNGGTLLDESLFTESFVTDTLGVFADKKILCKNMSFRNLNFIPMRLSPYY